MMDNSCSHHYVLATRGVTLAATFFLALSIAPVQAKMSDEGTKVSDVEISNTVSDRLLLDHGVASHAVDVSTLNGIATLTGSVNNILAKDRAADLARTVKGVRSVINRIKVDVPAIDDDQLESDVRTALLLNPRTELFEVITNARDGQVHLSGSVDSWQERTLVDNVVRGVRGVAGVTNEVTVETANRTEAEIREDIRGALRWDRFVDDALIEISVDGDTVTLSGIVGSAAERSRAVADAFVKGVRDVNSSSLAVDPWAKRDDLREGKFVARGDEAVRSAIQDALFQDPRVLASNVKVSVDGGIVTLRGQADYLGALSAARQVARDTVGVLWVRDRMRVRPLQAWADDTIVENIEAAWRRDPYVSAFSLSADSDNGVVRIEGTANSTLDRFRAESLAYGVPGVIEVNNHVDVVTATPVPYDPYLDDGLFPYDFAWYDPISTVARKSDDQIASEVRDQLLWSPFVDSDAVDVVVNDGVVVLKGKVDSWGERQAATENALEGGAWKVVNQLDVSFGS